MTGSQVAALIVAIVYVGVGIVGIRLSLKLRRQPTQQPKVEAYAPVTRVSVIDHREVGEGLVLEHYNVSISYALQDQGRTLKVWIKDDPNAPHDAVPGGSNTVCKVCGGWESNGIHP